ncbi:MAG: hypothetical protein U0M42_02775 [Acutalibacteraceae bacterium]|nr:hypothetical protein [Acutalibacteraceae bacterium]
MKKLLAILLALSMLLLCACSASDSSGNSSPSGGDNLDSSYTTSVSQTELDDTLESRSTAEEGPENSLDTTSASDRDEKNQEANDPGVKPGSNQSQDTTGKDKTKETLPSQSSGDGNSSESSKPNETTNPTETTKPQTEPTQKEPESTEPPAETVPTETRAGKNDTAAVAQRVLEYINQYRSSPATRLSGLTEYAQYRSRQLVSNFAHSTADQRAAATALQYGEYVDPSVFGGSGQPYYRANAREAIAKAGYVGTIDEVAMKLATLVKNSQNHWNYIGDTQYCYIAVGVTYESDMWYCAITVASENTDEY